MEKVERLSPFWFVNTSIMNFKNKLFEDKTSIIKNRLVLPDISDNSEKEEFKSILIDFFKKHPNYENKIDWNKVKTLTKADFQKVLDLEGTSKKAQKKEIQSDVRNIFKNVDERKFLIVGENLNWLFVAPLTYEAAVYCDSSENQGAGAKWCIGYEKDDSYWYKYIEEGSLFIMAFNKNYRSLSRKDIQTKLKYMIQKDEDGNYHIWNQEDIDTGSDLEKVGSENVILEEMFEKVKVGIDKEKELIKQKANEKVLEILKNCGDTIGKDTISEKYKKHLTKIEIPQSVKIIGNSAFYGCSGLKLIKIPNSVTSIEEYAFSSCKELISMKIPDSVTSIGDYAFEYCKGLTSVTIPDSVTSIGFSAFQGCSNLKSVSIGDSVMDIGYCAFYSCRNLTSVIISNSVTNIDSFAFENCNSNIVVTVSKDFDRSLLKDVGLPETAKFKIVD